MKLLSIGKKIWISIGILAMGYFISTAVGFYLGSVTERRLSGVSENLFPASMMSNAAVTAFDEQIKLYNDAVLMGEAAIFDKTKQKAQAVSENLSAVVNTEGIDPTIKEKISQTVNQHDKFSAEAQTVYRAMSAGTGNFSADQVAQLAQQTETIQKQLLDYKNTLSQNLKNELAALGEKSKSQRVVNGVLFLVVVAIAMVFAWVIITRAITRPLNNTVSMLRDIAEGEGDLTKRLAVDTKDEIGEMARWFNTFIEKLQGIIKEITGGVDTLSSSSSELSAISEQMTDGITKVSDKSNTVSAAAEEMSTNMNNVAAAMEQSATNTNMVAVSAEQMSATIDEIARNAERARGTSDEAAQKATSTSSNMDQLGEAADSIGKVVETITDISEQVNLLALNATIEAARAGEAGKGFAVVANEIKELAKQTAAATQDIKEKIDGIQSTTTTTVGQITEITRVITDVNDLVTTIATAVEEQSASTKDIATNVSQASRGIQEVNQNVGHSSSVADEISRDIADVSVSMNEMSNSSGQVSLSAQELSSLSDNLHRLVNQFKV